MSKGPSKKPAKAKAKSAEPDETQMSLIGGEAEEAEVEAAAEETAPASGGDSSEDASDDSAVSAASDGPDDSEDTSSEDGEDALAASVEGAEQTEEEPAPPPERITQLMNATDGCFKVVADGEKIELTDAEWQDALVEVFRRPEA